MVGKDTHIKSETALTSSEQLDERNLNVWGLRMRNVRRALLDVTGFGRHNADDTKQRLLINSVTEMGQTELTTWLTDSLLNIGTIGWVLGSPQHTGEILSGRVIIGAVLGLQREAKIADSRYILIHEGIRGATKEEMKVLTDSPEKGSLFHE